MTCACCRRAPMRPSRRIRCRDSSISSGAGAGGHGQQLLHRHRPVEQLVGGAPDGPHRADADLLLEAVAVADAEGLAPGRRSSLSLTWLDIRRHSVARTTESSLKRARGEASPGHPSRSGPTVRPTSRSVGRRDARGHGSPASHRPRRRALLPGPARRRVPARQPPDHPARRAGAARSALRRRRAADPGGHPPGGPRRADDARAGRRLRAAGGGHRHPVAVQPALRRGRTCSPSATCPGWASRCRGRCSC